MQSERDRSRASRNWRSVAAEAVVEPDGDHIRGEADLTSAPATIGLTTEKELFTLPKNKWSYSAPTDQFGANPHSNPTPTVSPQRVTLADATVTPPVLVLMLAPAGNAYSSTSKCSL